MASNRVRIFREDLMLSKAELARRAGLSALTIDRVESGRPCRLNTQRRILVALGPGVADQGCVVGERRGVAPVLRPTSNVPANPFSSMGDRSTVGRPQ